MNKDKVLRAGTSATISGVFAVLFFSFISTIIYSQNAKIDSFEQSGFMDFNGYYDTREMGFFTLNLQANISSRVEYFATFNLFKPLSESTANLEGSYIENHLWFKPIKKIPFDLTQYWVSINGPKNDALKYGVRWQAYKTRGVKDLLKKFNCFYFLNFYLVDFSPFKSIKGFNQVQHVYRVEVFPRYLKKRLYLSGFANHYFSFDEGKIQNAVVMEHQMGIRTFGGLFIVAEYRKNQFWDRANGLGLGLQYFLKF